MQGVIEGKSLGDVPVIPEHDASGISHDIKVLDDIAKQLRARRFQNGCVNAAFGQADAQSSLPHTKSLWRT